MGCAQYYKHSTGKSRKRILFDGVGEALEPLHQEAVHKVDKLFLKQKQTLPNYIRTISKS